MQTFFGCRTKQESGFTMVEFVLSAVIILLISAALFSILAETQRNSSYQTEVQAVLDNTRIAMDTVEGYVRQASNNPCAIAGFVGIGEGGDMSVASVRLRSDLTGSAGCAAPGCGCAVTDPSLKDKGDPDGNTDDAGEDVTISWNSGTNTVNITPQGGAAQPIANYISAFTLQYFDQNGIETAVAADVRKIRISMTGTTTLPHPQTKKTFGQTVSSDIQIATR
jgi:type II secretory pathway pseudopilin PulG